MKIISKRGRNLAPVENNFWKWTPADDISLESKLKALGINPSVLSFEETFKQKKEEIKSAVPELFPQTHTITASWSMSNEDLDSPLYMEMFDKFCKELDEDFDYFLGDLDDDATDL